MQYKSILFCVIIPYVYFRSTITCVAGIVVMSCCVGIILGIGLWRLCIAVNIILTGNATYATHCMAKITECIEVGPPAVYS